MAGISPLKFSTLPVIKESTPQIEVPIETRPGLVPSNDVYSPDISYPYSGELNEYLNDEYHPRNMKFWGYMIIALIVSTLLFIAEYTGGTSEEYKSLKKPPASPSLELVAILNVIVVVLATWVGYHMTKDHLSDTVRKISIFFLIAFYVLMGVWTILLFSDNSPGSAAFFIFATLVVIAAWIYFVWEYDEEHDLYCHLTIIAIWLVYMLYFAVGISVLNSFKQNKTKSKNRRKKCRKNRKK